MIILDGRTLHVVVLTDGDNVNEIAEAILSVAPEARVDVFGAIMAVGASDRSCIDIDPASPPTAEPETLVRGMQPAAPPPQTR